MYSRKIYRARDRIQSDCELTADGNFEPGISSCSLQFSGSQQQPFTPGLWSESPSQDSTGPAKPSSTTLLSHFEPPASAFYAAERFMRFPQSGSLIMACDPEFPLYQSYCRSFPIRSGDPPVVDHGALSWRQTSVPKENQDSKVSCNLYGQSKSGTSFTLQQEKQPRGLSSRSNNSTSSSRIFSVSTGSALPNKIRICWTQDLHEKFVECVNRLGGAEKATPKAILKLMDSHGLTIFHIKSHLQKYRIVKCIPGSAAGRNHDFETIDRRISSGRNERRTSLGAVPRLDLKGGLQVKEALQIQLDVQRQLHEQLEIQRKLQLRIEEQGRQLRMMFEQQQKTTEALLSNQNGTGPDDDRFPVAEGSENAYFPSKVS